MGVSFSVDDILEMAAQIERNGGVFYRIAAEKHEHLKKLLLDIAKQEDEHLATFKGMREEIAGGEGSSNCFDPDDQAGMYLRAMASGHVFDINADPSKGVTGEESKEEILKMAIGKEKDSIIFYLGLKEVVSSTAGKDKIMYIIQQEMNHIQWLSEKIEN